MNAPFFLVRLLCGSAAVLAASTQNASAIDPSGTAVAVIQATSASGPGGSRTLESQRPVYSGDRINTAQSGEAQIVFRDETRLVVGPNSSLVIDRFVFASDRTAADVSMRAVKGALRFISGSSSSQAYSIRTPTASLGIRGTQFDIAIGPNGETGLVVFSGAVQMCGRSGRCILVNEACGAAVALPDGRVERVTSPEEKARRLQQSISLRREPGLAQARLSREHRRLRRNCCGNGDRRLRLWWFRRRAWFWI